MPPSQEETVDWLGTMTRRSDQRTLVRDMTSTDLEGIHWVVQRYLDTYTQDDPRYATAYAFLGDLNDLIVRAKSL